MVEPVTRRSDYHAPALTLDLDYQHWQVIVHEDDLAFTFELPPQRASLRLLYSDNRYWNFNLP